METNLWRWCGRKSVLLESDTSMRNTGSHKPLPWRISNETFQRVNFTVSLTVGDHRPVMNHQAVFSRISKSSGGSPSRVCHSTLAKPVPNLRLPPARRHRLSSSSTTKNSSPLNHFPSTPLFTATLLSSTPLRYYTTNQPPLQRCYNSLLHPQTPNCAPLSSPRPAITTTS